MPPSTNLLDALPQAQRLAWGYARGKERERLLGFFSLDARLAGIVRNSREPMLAQLRLAWWREQLAGDPTTVPRGGPLLALLADWQDERRLLAGLVDGWERLTGDAPLPVAAFEQFAEARAHAIAALGGVDTLTEAAVRMGRNWALADLASRLSHPVERETVRTLSLGQDWTQARLPRALRPLAMLHALAKRNHAVGLPAHALTAKSALAMVRTGLLGR